MKVIVEIISLLLQAIISPIGFLYDLAKQLFFGILIYVLTIWEQPKRKTDEIYKKWLVILDLIWMHPVKTVFLIVFISSPSILNFYLFALLSILEELLLRLTSKICDLIQHIKFSHQVLRRFKGFHFEEIKIEEILSKKLLIDSLWSKIFNEAVFITYRKSRLIYFWSDTDFRLPTSLNTRHCFTTPSIITTPQDPRNVNEIGLFLLYHELIHTSSSHRRYYYLTLFSCVTFMIIPSFYINQCDIPLKNEFWIMIRPTIVYTIFLGTWKYDNKSEEFIADALGFISIVKKISDTQLKKLGDFLLSSRKNESYIFELEEVIDVVINKREGKDFDYILKKSLLRGRPNILFKTIFFVWMFDLIPKIKIIKEYNFDFIHINLLLIVFIIFSTLLINRFEKSINLQLER